MSTVTPDVAEDTDLAELLGNHVPCTNPDPCDREAKWVLCCTNGHSMVNRRHNYIPATLCDVHQKEFEQQIADDRKWVAKMLAEMKVPCRTCGAYIALPLNWRPL